MRSFFFFRNKPTVPTAVKSWKIHEVKAKRAESRKSYEEALRLYQEAYDALERYYDAFKNRESKYFRHKSSVYRFKINEVIGLLKKV